MTERGRTRSSQKRTYSPTCDDIFYIQDSSSSSSNIKLDFEIDQLHIKVESESPSDSESDLDSLDQWIITPINGNKGNDSDSDYEFVHPTSDPLGSSSSEDEQDSEDDDEIKKRRRNLKYDPKLTPREKAKIYFASLTSEERTQVNARLAQCSRRRRANFKETNVEQYQKFQEKERERRAKARARETPEQKEARLKRRRDKKLEIKKQFEDSVEAQVMALTQNEGETDQEFEQRRKELRDSLYAAERKRNYRPRKKPPDQLKRPPAPQLNLTPEERIARRREQARQHARNANAEQKERKRSRQRVIIAEKRVMQRKELNLFKEIVDSKDHNYKPSNVKEGIEIVEYWINSKKGVNVPDEVKQWRKIMLEWFKEEQEHELNDVRSFMEQHSGIVNDFFEGRVNYDREVTRRHHEKNRQKKQKQKTELTEEEHEERRKKIRESQTPEQKRQVAERQRRYQKKKREKLRLEKGLPPTEITSPRRARSPTEQKRKVAERQRRYQKRKREKLRLEKGLPPTEITSPRRARSPTEQKRKVAERQRRYQQKKREKLRLEKGLPATAITSPTRTSPTTTKLLKAVQNQEQFESPNESMDGIQSDNNINDNDWVDDVQQESSPIEQGLNQAHFGDLVNFNQNQGPTVLNVEPGCNNYNNDSSSSLYNLSQNPNPTTTYKDVEVEPGFIMTYSLPPQPSNWQSPYTQEVQNQNQFDSHYIEQQQLQPFPEIVDIIPAESIILTPAKRGRGRPRKDPNDDTPRKKRVRPEPGQPKRKSPTKIPEKNIIKHPNNISSELPPSLPIDDSKLLPKCKHCKQVFFAQAALDQHIQKMHSESVFGCKICSRKFENTYRLIRHIWNGHYEDRRTRACPICSATAISTKRLQQHVEKNHPQSSLQAFFKRGGADANNADGESKKFCCSFCSSAFPSFLELNKHFLEIHKGLSSHSCNCCGIVLRTEEHLADHINMFHSGKMQSLEENIEQGKIDESNLFSCQICDSKFSSAEFLNKHQKRGHFSNVPIINKKHYKSRLGPRCRACDKNFTSKTDRDHHARVLCPLLHLKCGWCFEIFNGEAEFQSHVEEKHSQEKIIPGRIPGGYLAYKCEVCRRSFGTLYFLRKHFHRDHVLHEDEDDPLQFSGEEQEENDNQEVVEIKLENEELEETDQEAVNTTTDQNTDSNSNSPPFVTCPYCAVNYKNDSFLQLHISQAHPDPEKRNERRIICDICQRTFSKGSGLNKHKREVHAANREIRCKVGCAHCPMISARVYHVREHIKRLHKELDPMDMKNIRNITEAEEQERASKVVNSHKCNLCYKSFPTEVKLKSHTTFVHARQHLTTFCDNYCGRQVRTGYLMDHIKSSHPEKLEEAKKLSLAKNTLQKIDLAQILKIIYEIQQLEEGEKLARRRKRLKLKAEEAMLKRKLKLVKKARAELGDVVSSDDQEEDEDEESSDESITGSKSDSGEEEAEDDEVELSPVKKDKSSSSLIVNTIQNKVQIIVKDKKMTHQKTTNKLSMIPVVALERCDDVIPKNIKIACITKKLPPENSRTTRSRTNYRNITHND